MNGNNIRSPNYFIVRWFFIFGLVFTAFFISYFNVSASVVMEGYKNFPSYSFPEKYNDKENIHKLNVLLENAKKEEYNILVCSGDSYNSSYYKNLKPYWILISNEPLNYDGINFYNNNSSTCEYFSCTLVVSDTDKYSNVNNFSNPNFEFSTNSSSNISKQYYPTVVYYNLPGGLNVLNGADTSFFPERLIEYDKNDLNTYPFDTICVTSPSEIKTNSNYYTFTFKGKIKLEDVDIEESVTPQIISKFIRNKFRYDFKSDKENLTGLSCLGAFKIDKEDSFTDEVLLQNLIDGKITFHNKKYDVTNFVDDFICGVSGDYKSWNSKGYYNFVVNTSIYVSDFPGANEYKFYFTVPYKFKGIFSYKTITVNYSLERGVYSDDNFDCIDDETLEVIPPEEVEIIHPDYVFPSTSTPSGSNNFDGDVVQNNNNNILINNGSDVSESERNGILNMLDNGLRTTTGRLKSLGTSLVGFKDSMTGLFSFLPQDVVNLFYLGISLSVVFFILGLRR